MTWARHLCEMTQVRLIVEPLSTCKSGEPWIRTCGTVRLYLIRIFTFFFFKVQKRWLMMSDQRLNFWGRDRTLKSLWLRCMRNLGQLWYWDLGDRIMESGLSISKTWSNLMVYNKISFPQILSSWSYIHKSKKHFFFGFSVQNIQWKKCENLSKGCLTNYSICYSVLIISVFSA